MPCGLVARVFTNWIIDDDVDMVAKGKTSQLTTPLEVLEKLHNYADRASEILKDLGQFENKELSYTLEDIWSISYLGKY